MAAPDRGRAGGRRAARAAAERVRRVPLAAHGERRAAPAAGARGGHVPRPGDAVLLDGHLPRRGARAPTMADDPGRPADGAGAVHAGRGASSPRRGVTQFVEIGSGNVLTGLVKRIDRSVQAISVSTPDGLAEAARLPVSELRRTASRSSPAARGASAGRSRSSWRAPARAWRVNYAARSDAADEVVGRDQGGRRRRRRAAGRRGRPRSRPPALVEADRGGVRRRPLERRLQRRHHARQPDGADRRRRLARGDRHQPRRHVPRLQGGQPQAAAQAARRDRDDVERRRRARQPGPDQLRGLQGRRDRAHQGAREGGRLARHPRQLHRARLHHDRADRRAAGGGARRNPRARRRSRGWAIPRTSRVSVRFLLSDDAAYITGAVIPVDGGMGM